MADTSLQRRHALLDAAIADMLAHGAHHLKIERVARAAEVAKGTVYLHFPTRTALIHAALHRGIIPGELPLLLAAVPHRRINPGNAAVVIDLLWTALEERDEVIRILVRDGFEVLGAESRSALRTALDSLVSMIDTSDPRLVATSLLAMTFSAYVADPARARHPSLTQLWSRLLIA